MKPKNIKSAIFIYLPYECIAVEEYLEKKAEEGWLLESIKGYIFKFKKIEPKKIKYSVDILQDVSVFDYKENNEALGYKEYCEAAGWTYVCQTGKIQVYYTEDCTGSIPIHTDMREKFKSILKSALLPIGIIFLWVLVPLYQEYNLFINGNELDSILPSNLGLLSIVINILFVFIICTEIISFIHWVIKARRVLKYNKFMPYNNYKQLRIKNNLIKVYLAVATFMIIIAPITTKEEDWGFYVFLIIVMLIPVILIWGAIKFINKKRYSRNINISIIISSVLFSFVFSGVLLGSLFWNYNTLVDVKVSSGDAGLTLKDFGYEDHVSDFNSQEESIIAKRTSYLSEDEGKDIMYDIFECEYPWIINMHTNKLLDNYNKGKISLDIKEIVSLLPNNVKVYSNSNKRKYILVSSDKVIDISKDLDEISEEEFLDIVYKKIFLKG